MKTEHLFLRKYIQKLLSEACLTNQAEQSQGSSHLLDENLQFLNPKNSDKDGKRGKK